MARIFWDANLFIYWLEDYADLSDRVAALYSRMRERGDRLVTSTMTVGEVLVKPIATGNLDVQRRFEHAISVSAEVHGLDVPAARRYAAIRAEGGIRPPDAIQLACAAEAGVDLFITNDDRLSRRNVPGIAFITSLERAFL